MGVGCKKVPAGCFDFVRLQEAVRTALGWRVPSQYSQGSIFPLRRRLTSWHAPVVWSAELLKGVTASSAPPPTHPEPIEPIAGTSLPGSDMIHPRRAREEPQQRDCGPVFQRAPLPMQRSCA